MSHSASGFFALVRPILHTNSSTIVDLVGRRIDGVISHNKRPREPTRHLVQGPATNEALTWTRVFPSLAQVDRLEELQPASG